MKVLISPIGSRGDVQPLVALGLELQARGHTIRFCASPDFRTWIESFGLQFTAVGQDFRATMASSGGKQSWQQFSQFNRNSLQEQFRVLPEISAQCDLLVGAGLQYAAPSIASSLGVPYVYVSYFSGGLPSAAYPPPPMSHRKLPGWMNRTLWKAGEGVWNTMLRKVLNEQRSALGLPSIKNVFRYLITEHPWLAADPTLSPVCSAERPATQTGAWLLRDPAPLSDRVQQFLSAGDPPIYFGFGSMPGRKPEHTARLMIAAARALKRRAIISRGWSGLSTSEVAGDVIAIDSEPHDKLFARVAAVVHHGGAGTTATAARAGKPQVLIPHLWDQFYWGDRVRQLQLGEWVSGTTRLTADKLVAALGKCLTPEAGARAQALANHIELNGARSAAEILSERFGRELLRDSYPRKTASAAYGLAPLV